MARALIPLAQGCEELEAVTVIDLLRRAGIEVVSASLDDQPVRASRGVVLLADAILDDVKDAHYDILILPGGAGGSQLLDNDPRIHSLIHRHLDRGAYVAAICAAPQVLAHAGALNNRRATSYPGAINPAEIPGMTYLTDAVVQDGQIITSRGPGTAMDFSLYLIELLCGRDQCQQVEASLQRQGKDTGG